MRKSLLALTLLSLTISTGTFAQQQQQRSGTPEEQAACNRDVQRHCRKLIDQGDFVILACLQQNRAQISAACNQVLKNHGQYAHNGCRRASAASRSQHWFWRRIPLYGARVPLRARAFHGPAPSQ